jgi:hypothetical protein
LFSRVFLVGRSSNFYLSSVIFYQHFFPFFSDLKIKGWMFI